MTPVERLEDAGGLQSRNPLVARAFRFLGFAEAAGSGLRVLRAAWRGARRPPPAISSDREANSFGLQLSWRPVAETFDAAVAEAGHHDHPDAGEIVERAGQPGGVTVQALADAFGLPGDKLSADLRHLVVQRLIDDCGERYQIAPHWKGMS